MDLIYLLNTSSLWLLVVTGLFSLLIGSFLNVVIYRLPIMLERQWKRECHEILGDTNSTHINEEQEHYNLVLPRSRCPNCHHMITALENIPILSYLVLRGKCRNCCNPISLQYPVIEIITACLSMIVAWQFGFSWQLTLGLIFTWSLISLFMIDAKTMFLPDNITLPLMWLGILANYYGVFTDLSSSVLGAMIGYMALWIVYQMFRLITGKEGMGYGDFKLLAALGAWGGWQILPFVIFSASTAGAIFGIAWLLIQRSKESTPLPFGPWLALAGWIAFVWHDVITQQTQRFLFP